MTSPLLSAAVCFALTAVVAAQRSGTAEAFLKETGVDPDRRVLYYKRSDNVSACLQYPDANARVIRLCASQTLIAQCIDPDFAFRFADCQGDACRMRFSVKHTACLLQRSGVLAELNVTLTPELCGSLRSGLPFLDWHPPPFVETIGGANNFDCLTAMPPGTRLERRIICKGKGPVLEHRMKLGDAEFLRSRNGEATSLSCISKIHCGVPTLFAGEMACYENDPDNKAFLALDDETDFLDSEGKTSAATASVISPLLRLCSLILAFVMF